MIHNWMNRGGLANTNVGKAGEITTALANAVKSFGGEIRTEAEVKASKLKAKLPRALFSQMAKRFLQIKSSPPQTRSTPCSNLSAHKICRPEFVWHTQSIKMRGSVAKVHLQTNGSHGIPEGTVVLAPSIKYLERAYDAAKYGEISEKPYLEVTTSGNVVSIHFQSAPYALRNSEWKVESGNIDKLAIDTLSEYFPNLKSSIVNRKLISPLDLEATYGLTEGDLNHGQLMLDQF
ncbi:MAG: hypothetical protein IPO36_08020, partial [Anaerolineales bacterium]|nr:hypothetical protein [Anaerolineales bacterium]